MARLMSYDSRATLTATSGATGPLVRSPSRDRHW
jgi:hypothetical protein